MKNTQGTQEASDLVPGRPGIALKVRPEGDGVRVTVALDFLRKTTDVPRFAGVRNYTYPVPFGPKPVRVGWVPKGANDAYTPPTEYVILRNRIYRFTRTDVDRQENGAMTVERVAGQRQKVHLQGVYCYFGMVFILNETLEFDQPALLYPPP